MQWLCCVLRCCRSCSRFVERRACRLAPATAAGVSAARLLLIAGALWPCAALSVALLLFEQRLSWQVWRLPFCSELVVGRYEAIAFRAALLVEGLLTWVLGMLLFGVQRVWARPVGHGGCSDEDAALMGADEDAAFMGAPLRGVLFQSPSFFAWVSCLQLMATSFHSIGSVLVASLDFHEHLACHMAALIFMHEAASAWLALQCIVDAASSQPQAADAQSVSSRICAGLGYVDHYVDRVLVPRTRRVAKKFGLDDVGRREVGFYFRSLSGFVCLCALNMMILGGGVISSVPMDIVAVMEVHARSGVQANDPAFPLRAINLLALTEWGMLVGLPFVNLLSCWDSVALLAREAPPKPPAAMIGRDSEQLD